MSGRRRITYKHRAAAWERIIGYSDIKNSDFCGPLRICRYSFHTGKFSGSKRIIFFSDMHWPSSRRLCSVLAEKCAEFSPDIIIFGGDIMSFTGNIADAMEFFASLPAREMKLAVRGNWEGRRRRDFSTAFLIDSYRQAGFELLLNSYTATDKIFFYGLDDLKTNNSVLMPGTAVPRGKYSITIGHSPDAVVNGCRNSQLSDFDLALCGHTHGGQVRLPWFGALKTSSRYGCRFDYGLYRNRYTNSNMLVSSGIGTSCIPLRFLCAPEILLVEIAGN